MSDPPIVRRLIILVFCIGIGLFITLLGWQNFYENRRRFGAFQIGIGVLIGLFGLFVWWTNGLRFTWAWVL